MKRQAIQFVYSGWFLLELVLRFAVDGRKLFYGEDRVMNHHLGGRVHGWKCLFTELMIYRLDGII